MKNITLIGMPAVGKSTIGVVVAKILAMNFVDTDLIIQQAQKKCLKEIIDDDGLAGFLEAESSAIRSLQCYDSIIATGGSAVYSAGGMAHLKAISTIIYLKADFGVINKRLGNIKNRGVVVRNGQSLYDLYEERCPLYEKYADIIIDEDNKTLEEVAQEIVAKINDMSQLER